MPMKNHSYLYVYFTSKRASLYRNELRNKIDYLEDIYSNKLHREATHYRIDGKIP